MMEPTSADGQKRAAWVGLRTLRQRPKLVGQAKDGQQIFEIRSVRLILPDNADHFTRLAQCSRCDREVPGARVLTPADLSRPSHPVICKECVGTATVAARRRERAAGGDAESPPSQSADVAEIASQVVSEPAVPAADDGRIATLESQLLAVTGLLTDLADAQRSESVRQQEADEATQSEMSAALARSIDEAHAGKSLTKVVELVRTDLEALATGLAEVRAWISAQPTSALQVEVFRREIAQAEARVAGSLVAQRDELYDALNEGLASLEQRLRSVEAALTQSANAQGQDGTPPAPVPAPVGPSLLDDLDRQLQEAETRLARRLFTGDR